MNNFDELDRKLESIFNAEIYEPDSYTTAIVNALNNKKRTSISIARIITAILAGLMLIGGVVYAKQIGEFIRRFFNNSLGTDTAVENGYVDTVNIPFETSSNIEITMKDLLVDDYNISFTIEIDQKYNEYLIDIENMIITDNNFNVLFCGNPNILKEYCAKYGLDYEYSNYSEKYMNTHIYKNQTFNKNVVSYNLKSTTPFQKSEKIFIEFKRISSHLTDAIEEINGVWKMEINLSEKFYSRTSHSYKVIEKTETFFDYIKFDIYNTETILEFKAMLKPLITDEMTEIERNEALEKFIEYGLNTDKEAVKDIYLINEYNQVFKLINDNQNDEKIDYYKDGTLYYKDTFDLTKYDMTDTLMLYFTINTPNENKDVVIKLQREN